MLNNPKLDVNINAYAKFSKNPSSKFSQDTCIEPKQKCYRWMDGQIDRPKNSIPHLYFICGGIIMCIYLFSTNLNIFNIIRKTNAAFLQAKRHQPLHGLIRKTNQMNGVKPLTTFLLWFSSLVSLGNLGGFLLPSSIRFFSMTSRAYSNCLCRFSS